MAGYAAPLILGTIVEQFRDLAQQALVGRRLDIASAGQYRYGRRIGNLPGQAIIQVASYVLFPAFARIAADIERFKHGFLRSLRMLWAGSTPFAAILVALGQPLIVVLLGEQWRPAGLFVAAMAGYGPGTAMSAIGYESIKGAGQSKKLNWLTGITLVVGLGGLLLLIPLGLVGVGLAASIEGVVSGLAGLLLARRLAGVSLRDLTGVLLPPLVAAAVAGGLVGFLEHGFVHSDQRPTVVALILLAAEGMLLLGIFVGLLFVMAPNTVRELRDGLLRRAGRGRRDDDGSADVPDDGPGPRPDDADSFFDAPTEVLPIFGLDAPTEQVYSPLGRVSRTPFPAPPLALTAPVPSPTPAPGRASRVHGVGLDAPTTAIPPDGHRDAVRTPELREGQGAGEPTDGTSTNGTDAPEPPSPGAPDGAPRLVPMQISPTRQDDRRLGPSEPGA
jgi:PST family polysaccharide transporter